MDDRELKQLMKIIGGAIIKGIRLSKQVTPLEPEEKILKKVANIIADAVIKCWEVFDAHYKKGAKKLKKNKNLQK
jgi:hypothetical protein